MDPELKEFDIQGVDGRIADVMKLNPKNQDGGDDGGGSEDDGDSFGGGGGGGGGDDADDDIGDVDDADDADDADDVDDDDDDAGLIDDDKSNKSDEAEAEDGDDSGDPDTDSGTDDDDIEDADDTNKFKKFNQSLRANYITETHPESASHNDDEIHSLAHVVRDPTGAIIDPLHRTIPILTKYEKTRILGVRTKQINEGAPPYVSVKSTIIDGYIIAMRELEEKKIPFIVRRPLPNGGSEYWYLQDLEII